MKKEQIIVILIGMLFAVSGSIFEFPEAMSSVLVKEIGIGIALGALFVSLIEKSPTKTQKNESSEVPLSINLGTTGTGWESAYTINGLLVREFNYLFRYILTLQDKINKDSRIDDQENIGLYAENYEMLEKIIDDEMSKPVLKEEEAYKVSHDTAKGNLHELKGMLFVMKEHSERLSEKQRTNS